MIVLFNPISTTPGKQPLPLSLMSLAAVLEGGPTVSETRSQRRGLRDAVSETRSQTRPMTQSRPASLAS